MLSGSSFQFNSKQGYSVVIAAATQSEADAIKTSLALRNEPVQAVSHQALAEMETTPLLFILDTRHLNDTSSLIWLQKAPTLILSETFDEEQFLSARENGALDYLVHPIPLAYLLSKVLDALKQIQEKHQAERYRKLLQQLGAIKERSGVFSTAQTLNRLDEAITEYCAGPDSSQSLLLLSWTGMPIPCPKNVEAGIYQAIARRVRSVARANDWVGEYLEEKFLIILPNTTSSGADAFAGRLAEKLKAPIHVLKHGDIELRFSLKTAEYQQGQHYEAWLKQALPEARK